MIKKIDYKALRQELDEILTNLEDDSLDVEVITAQYQRGMEIIQQLEDYLKTAQNKVRKIKADWDAPKTV